MADIQPAEEDKQDLQSFALSPQANVIGLRLAWRGTDLPILMLSTQHASKSKCGVAGESFQPWPMRVWCSLSWRPPSGCRPDGHCGRQELVATTQGHHYSKIKLTISSYRCTRKRVRHTQQVSGTGRHTDWCTGNSFTVKTKTSKHKWQSS